MSMEMLGKNRRMYFRDKLSLHQIAKRTGLSRNTIRKWVRAPEATQPAYQRCASFNKLNPFHETLEQALKADSFRPKHNRRSAKALFEQIKAEGYDGGYSQLTAFVRSWRCEQGKSVRAFVPLTFALGEAFQFDWSEEGLLIGGLFRRIQVSHMKLCASRAFWLVAYPSQPELLGMVECVWRRQDDHRVAGSADTPLPHRRNGQRVLPPTTQHIGCPDKDQNTRTKAKGRK
ncbi:Fused ISPsy20 transposase IstB/transcriptional regulator LysR protein [Pseudomonas syringae pv. berberidis]|nr:Fused ISPsy20 transposase IstB/transcriptional regulator LysR protein [Pseudomonas syringae pv. berberidis]